MFIKQLDPVIRIYKRPTQPLITTRNHSKQSFSGWERTQTPAINLQLEQIETPTSPKKKLKPLKSSLKVSTTNQTSSNKHYSLVEFLISPPSSQPKAVLPQSSVTQFISQSIQDSFSSANTGESSTYENSTKLTNQLNSKIRNEELNKDLNSTIVLHEFNELQEITKQLITEAGKIQNNNQYSQQRFLVCDLHKPIPKRKTKMFEPTYVTDTKSPVLENVQQSSNGLVTKQVPYRTPKVTQFYQFSTLSKRSNSCNVPSIYGPRTVFKILEKVDKQSVLPQLQKLKNPVCTMIDSANANYLNNKGLVCRLQPDMSRKAKYQEHLKRRKSVIFQHKFNQ